MLHYHFIVCQNSLVNRLLSNFLHENFCYISINQIFFGTFKKNFVSESTIRRIFMKGNWFTSFEGVTLYGGPRASSLLNIPEPNSFHHEYNSMACTIEIVDDVHAAIGHIHQHGRHVAVLFRSYLCSHLLHSLTSFLFPSAAGTLIASLQMTVKLRKFFYAKWTGRMLRLFGAHLVLRCFGFLIHSCLNFETESLT